MKKVMAVILVMVLVLGCFAACSPQEEQQESSESSVAELDSSAVENSNEEAENSEMESEADDKAEPIDLMNMAIDASTYKRTNLQNLATKNYGKGVFADFHEMFKNPLTAGEYMLANTAYAKEIDSPATFSKFYSNMLENYGARVAKKELNADKDLALALERLYELENDGAGLARALKQSENINEKMKEPLARFINSAVDSYKTIKEVFAENGEISFDALMEFEFYTMTGGDMDNLSRMMGIYYTVDFDRVLEAGGNMLEVSGVVASRARTVKKVTVDGEPIVMETPIGNIVFGSEGSDTYDSPNTLLLVDPAGNDIYNGRVAANSFENPISVLIDVEGNDTYNGDSVTQGCGLMGIGLLYDLEGRDLYSAKCLAQGCSVLGVGVLYDAVGDDTYRGDMNVQAAGHYGMAILADLSGNDNYNAIAYAQASAGNRCQAYLIDAKGNDNYYVSPKVVKGYEEAGYDMYTGFNTNNSQGCGWGNRNITTGERGVAGGIAGLMDISGDDIYQGGVWVLGGGYWGGIGFVVDTDGDDIYESCYYSQASACHYGIGMHADIGGNDKYALRTVGGGAGLSFTWDRGLSLLINDGGDDRYITTKTSLGYAWSEYDDKGEEWQDMCYSIFVDTEGNDNYYDYDGMGFGRGGYFIDAQGNDILNTWQADDENFVFSGKKLVGGVYIDYPEENGVIGFWKEAKKAYLK